MALYEYQQIKFIMDTISRINQGVARLWWVPLLTGLICIGLGIWTFCSPIESMEVLAYVFAAIMLAAGVLDISFALMNSGITSNWGWSLALGLLELIAGIWLFTLPAVALTGVFVFVIGVWILVAAVNSICEAASLSNVSGWWTVWMILMLIATVAFAVIFLSDPIAGGVAVWLWVGLSLICFGVYRLFLAAALRRWIG